MDGVLKTTLKVLSPVKATPLFKMGIEIHLMVSLGKKVRDVWIGLKSTPARGGEREVRGRRGGNGQCPLHVAVSEVVFKVTVML